MRNKKRIIVLRPLAAACLLLLAIGVTSETYGQRESVGTFKIVSSGSVGLIQNETVRLTIYNPTAAPVSGHVRVFSGTGQLVLSANNTYIGAGASQFFDFNYTDLEEVPGEPQTGRRQIIVQATISYDGLESEAAKIKPGMELRSTDSGKTWTLVQLLPAIQKVR